MTGASTIPDPPVRTAGGAQQNPAKPTTTNRNPAPAKTQRSIVMVDEASVYDVYLLFVWQFSKILIQVSKVELNFFYYFFFNFFFPVFIIVYGPVVFVTSTECLTSVPVNRENHSALF